MVLLPGSTSEGEWIVTDIREGGDYQATCSEWKPEILCKPEWLVERATSPPEDIPDLKLKEYITLAKNQYGYNTEQAMAMLCWHKNDLDRAVLDLPNFAPIPDEWSVEDKNMQTRYNAMNIDDSNEGIGMIKEELEKLAVTQYSKISMK